MHFETFGQNPTALIIFG